MKLINNLEGIKAMKSINIVFALVLFGALAVSNVSATPASLNGNNWTGIDSVYNSLGLPYLGVFDVRSFGAIGDGSHDDTAAFQAAINTGNAYCGEGRYLITSTLNMTYRDGYKLAGKESYSYQKGCILVGSTGTNAVIETSGSDGTVLDGIGIVSGVSSPSQIGIIQARDTIRGWAGDQVFNNIYINLDSNVNANSGQGTIGMINFAGEETKYNNLQIWANLPLILTWSKGYAITNQSIIGQSFYAVSSSTGVSLPSSGSATIATFSGQTRLISYDRISPVILNNGFASVTFENLFTQKRAGTTGQTQGINNISIETWNSYQFKMYGVTEGSSIAFLNRRDMTQADINLRMGTNSETVLPVIMLYDDGGVYSLSDSNIKIYSYDSIRPLIDGKKYDGAVSEPYNIAITNNKFISNLNVTNKTILRVSKNTEYINSLSPYNNLDVGLNHQSFEIFKNLGGNGISTPVFNLVMPTYVANLGAFGASIIMEGQLTNVLGGGTGSPSVNNFRATFNIGTIHNSGNIVVSDILVTADNPAITLEAANKITGLNIIATVNNASNVIQINASGIESGANNADIILIGKVNIFYNGAYKDTIQFQLPTSNISGTIISGTSLNKLTNISAGTNVSISWNNGVATISSTGGSGGNSSYNATYDGYLTIISSLQLNDSVDRTYVNNTFLPVGTYNGNFPNSTVASNLANWNSTTNSSYDANLIRNIKFSVNNGSNVISTGVKPDADVEMPCTGTIIQSSTFADQTGSTNISWWKDTYANYPPTAADLLGSQTIVTSTKGQSGVLSQAVTVGDIMRFNIESATTITSVSLNLKLRCS